MAPCIAGLHAHALVPTTEPPRAGAIKLVGIAAFASTSPFRESRSIFENPTSLLADLHIARFATCLAAAPGLVSVTLPLASFTSDPTALGCSQWRSIDAARSE